MQNSKIINALIILVVALVGFLLFVGRNDDSQKSRQDTGSEVSQVPDFSLKDFEGNTVTRADFAGKPLVINSWAAWCPFCREELKDFAAVQKEFDGEVVFIAIDRAEPLDVAREFADAQGISDDLVLLLDPDDTFYDAIGGITMPETVFVDARGRIVDHKRGPMDEVEMREKVNNLVGG